MNYFYCLDCKNTIFIRHLKLEEEKPEQVICDRCNTEWRVTVNLGALSYARVKPKPKQPGIKTKARIPCEYVVTKGAGQTSFGPGIDPWETAAYDIALEQAGIQNCNVVKYTSVLPPESNPISMNAAKERGLFHHGMVLETIMAQVNGSKNQHICAGIGTCQVYELIKGEHEARQKGNHLGGFAAEYEGYGSPQRAKQLLEEALKGIVQRRYKHEVWVDDFSYTTQDLVVDEAYGCVLVALGFLTFEHPLDGPIIVGSFPDNKTWEQVYKDFEDDPEFGKVVVRENKGPIEKEGR